jgi:hypothetical protein
MQHAVGQKLETTVESRHGLIDRSVLIVITVSAVFAGLLAGVFWLGYSSL